LNSFIRPQILVLILVILTLSSPYLVYKAHALPAAILRVSLPAGTGVGPDSDPWLSECWLLNLEGETQTFVLRINNTSASQRSYDTHLVVALNEAGYNNLASLIMNGIAVPKTAFKYGTPTPYNIWTWPSGDIYPTWFNDTLVNVGTVQRNSFAEVTVSVTFSNATGARMHFDAWGKRISGTTTSDSDVTHNSPSADSTVLFQPGAPQPQPPYAAFSFTPSFPEVGEIVTFNASPSYDPDGNIVSYSWNFGDGTPIVVESDPIATHSYAALGDYEVTLTVTDNDGLTGTAADIVHVCLPPVASFVFSPPDPLEHETVTFDASSSAPDGGTIISYKWDFGDGTITTVSNPVITHSYAVYGNYTIILNVTDNDGKWDTDSKQITVERLPIADFTWSPVYPEVYEIVTFDASYSTPDGGVIVSYEWDFGDGAPKVIETDPITTRHYTAAGNYAVILNVTDSEGRWDTESKTITVRAPPHAEFVWYPIYPYTYELITFNASGSHDTDGYIVSYTWNFGDGNTTSTDNSVITHMYADCANYTVTLTVTDNTGLTGYTSQTVTVFNPDLLRLWADVGSYVGSHSDTWIHESWIVSSDVPPGSSVSFNLYIDAKSNPDGKNPTYDVYLAVAVNDTAQVASITIGPTTITTFTYGEVTWPAVAGGGTLPSHGVYPTWYALAPFGDVASNHGYYMTPSDPYGPYWAFRAYIPVTITTSSTMNAGLKVHFDAQGVLVKGSTAPGHRNSNPFSHDLTFAGTYIPPVTADVTFAQVGVGTDFTGTVLTVDGVNYTRGELPKTFTWVVGSEHTFEYHSPLVVDTGKRYVWTHTLGLSTARSGTIIVPSGGGSVTGYYKTQYKVTFTQTGLDGTAIGIVVTVAGVSKTYTDLPFTTDWLDHGSTLAFEYSDNVASSVSGKQFKLVSVSHTSPLTVTAPITVTGNYKIQYRITVTADPSGALGGTFKVTYTQCGTTYTNMQNTTLWIEWVDSSTTVTVSEPQDIINVSPGIRYKFDSYVPSASVHMDQAKTITLVYKTQYYLTVRVDPPGITTIPGEGWHNATLTVSLLAPPVPNYEFKNWTVDGSLVPGNPINVPMDNPHTAIAYYIKIEPLSVSITPTTAKIKIGESVTFTSTVSGGKPPYTPQWYLNGSAVSGATSLTWTFIPPTPGYYIVYLNVTDSTSTTAKSNEASVTVAPTLTVSISPMSASILVGQSVTFTSTVSGGYPPYSYQWYLGGAPVSGATSSSWTFTPSASGIYYVYLEVTDANKNTAQSETARITVSAVPVGGYSISLTKQTPTSHIAAYAMLIALSGIALSLKKRKRK